MAGLFSPQNPPKVIMLPNEVFALACRAYYDEQGLIVDETNGEFAHCPLPKGMGDRGYYLLWEHHQQQGLLQSRDVDRKCFFNADVKKWLLTCNYWPDNFFELWDTYEHYTREHAKNSLRKVTHDQRSEMMLKVWSNLSPEQRSVRARKTVDKVSFETRSANSYRAHIRTVEIAFPDGRVGVYPSVSLASVAIGVDAETVRKWVIKQTPLKQGKHKGYSARYV